MTRASGDYVLYLSEPDGACKPADETLEKYRERYKQEVLEEIRKDEVIIRRFKTGQEAIATARPIVHLYNRLRCKITKRHRWERLTTLPRGRELHACSRCLVELQIIIPPAVHYNCRSTFAPIFGESP